MLNQINILKHPSIKDIPLLDTPSPFTKLSFATNEMERHTIWIPAHSEDSLIHSLTLN